MSENKIVKKDNENKYAKRKEVLTSFFLDDKYTPVTRKQIAVIFNINKNDQQILDTMLEEIQSEGIVYIDESKRFISFAKSNLVKCTYLSKSSSFGFGLVDSGEDIYISTKNLNSAMDGDEILVEILKSSGRSREGKVVKILKRSIRTIIGRFNKSRNFGFVIPIDDSINDIYISKKNAMNIKEGQVVEVELVKYPTNTEKAEGKIVRVIGNASDHNIDVKSLYISYNLDLLEKFNQKIEEELKEIPTQVLDIEKKGRENRTTERIYTIDGEDAKDLDDAICVKKMDNGNYSLSVYIADVSHYVKEGSAIDKEAIARGTSIYMPGTVVPMLPKQLSNGICSLNENVERLTLGIDMLISNTGEVLGSEVFKGVIKVTKRMSYEKVYKVLNDEIIEDYIPYKEDILLMEELAKILNKKRVAEGCINFDIPETHVVLDEEGEVTKIEPYPITFANKLIEEFMLISNMVIAEKYNFQELPFIYRIHEKPDEEKLRDLNTILANYKLRIKGIKEVHPKALSSILDSITDEDQKGIISNYMLRTLKLAKYSNECLGHFGLSATYYCHFTSPIRRYPDLFIHRIISKVIDNKFSWNEKELAKYEKRAEDYSKSSSEAEKHATKIERDFESLYTTMYMANFIGDIYEARISSIKSFGIFVKLDTTVEGFVGFNDIPGDYYLYDEKRKILIGKSTGNTYKIGDKVKVKLIKSDVKTKQIDFEII